MTTYIRRRTYPSVNYATNRSANGLWPGWHWAVIWTNAETLLIGPLGINFREISIEIHTFLLKKNVLENVVPENGGHFVCTSTCFHLVKNGLRRIIRAGSKYLIHSLAFAVMPWWRWDDWRVPQGCISVFIVSMSIKYWGSFAFYTCDKFWDSEHEICLVSLMTLTFWILDQYVHFLLQINTRKVFVFAIWMYGLNHIPKLLYWITCGTRSVNYISSSAQYRMIHVSISSLHLDISSNQIR